MTNRASDARRSSGGADRARLAEWEAEAFTALRRHRDAETPVDDELPELGDWLAAEGSRSVGRMPM